MGRKQKDTEEMVPLKELLNLKRKMVKLANLYLDPNNPRFGIGRATPDQRILEDAVQQNTQSKIEEIGIDDLKSSIKRYGFVPTDPVVVRQLQDYKFVVIEGNRRVASLKKLVSSHTKGDSTFDPDILNSMVNFEVLLYEGKDPKIAWIVQGIRHMSGIKEWPPLQQATFIAMIEQEVKKIHGSSIGIPTIAKKAGIKPAKVNLLLNSYYGFQQAREDEEFGEAISDDKFSMFSEAIFKVENLQKWLGWDSNSKRFKNIENLRKFLSWITPPEDGGEAKIIRALDVRDVLPDIISSTELLRRFEKGILDLNQARVEIETKKPPHEPDLKFLKEQLNEFRNVLDTLPLPKIERENQKEEFKLLLKGLKDSIEIQIKNLAK